MRKNLFGAFMTLSLLTIVACNGGGGSGGSSKKDDGIDEENPSTVPSSYQLPASLGTINGVLIDSPVSGLDYTTSDTHAVTGPGGSFTCRAGAVVSFHIGGYKIADVPCLPVITPIELATKGRIRAKAASFVGSSASELTAAENNKMQRIASLLQTIDTDGNLSNGIAITGTVVMALSDVLNDNDTSLEEALQDGPIDDGWEGALQALTSSLGGQYQVHADPAAVMSHFKATLAANPICTTANVANSQSVSGIISRCIALSCTSGFMIQNGTCVQVQQVVLGCTDSTASNYNPSATQDNGSCIPGGPQGEYTCLIGYLAMDSFYPAEAAINSANGLPLTRFTGTYNPIRTKAVVVLEDNSSKATLYRPHFYWTADHDAISYNNLVSGGNWWRFEGYYNLVPIPGEGLMVSQIQYQNSNQFLYFPQTIDLAASTAEVTNTSSGVSSYADRTWTIQRNCNLPAEGRVSELSDI